MKIIVANNIRVINPDETIKTYAEEQLVIPNPDFIKNARLGYSNYSTPRNLVYYEINGNELILPFGCLRDLFLMYPSNIFENRIGQAEKITYKSNIKLFDYQEQACQAGLKKKNGIIVMPARVWKDTNSTRDDSKVGFKDTLDNSYYRFIKSEL